MPQMVLLVLAEVQEKLDEGLNPSEVADQPDLKRDTLRKAIRAGRLHRPKKKRKSYRQLGCPSCQYEERTQHRRQPSADRHGSHQCECSDTALNNVACKNSCFFT